jgi:hypothetical protein
MTTALLPDGRQFSRESQRKDVGRHVPRDAFVFPKCRNKLSLYHQSLDDNEMDFEVVLTAYHPQKEDAVQAATSTYGHHH